MDRFNERYLQTIDARGRLQLSRDIRSEFGLKKGDLLYLLPTPGERPHLQIRTARQWQDYQGRLREKTPGHRKSDFLRFVNLVKESVRSDAQGRIGVPQRIREQCRLNGRVLVINMGYCVEVWNPEFVRDKFADFTRAFQEINDSLY